LSGEGCYRLVETAEARRFRIEIPPESPLFAGHFPGQPILPGIAQLAIVERALGAPLAAVRGLRLRQRVLPGERLDLSLGAPDPEGWVRFEIRREAAVVAGGAVRTSQAGGGEELAMPPVHAAGELPVLLPHAPPARLVRSVVHASGEEILCVAEIPPDHPLAAGHAPACLGVEAAAQAAAVLEALARREEDAGPRIGYLVGIREARFAIPFLPAGRAFQVTARLTGSAPPLSIYEITTGDGSAGVTATISTFLATGADGRDQAGGPAEISI
jgi:3-hydroxymyristoyl/3-hydroxydecanoyl-(acyl carrier protein) dehydratase